MGRIAAEIKARLSTLPDAGIILDNQSDRHAGHAGSPGTGESHFHVIVTSSAFTGLSRIQRQRLALEKIGDLFDQGLHALSITAKTPDEA